MAALKIGAKPSTGQWQQSGHLSRVRRRSRSRTAKAVSPVASPFWNLCCCQTTNPKTPARRSLVDGSGERSGPTGSGRLRSMLPRHRRNPLPAAADDAVPAATATVCRAPPLLLGDGDIALVKRELAEARHKSLVRLGQPPASRARHARKARTHNVLPLTQQRPRPRCPEPARRKVTRGGRGCQVRGGGRR